MQYFSNLPKRREQERSGSETVLNEGKLQWACQWGFKAGHVFDLGPEPPPDLLDPRSRCHRAAPGPGTHQVPDGTFPRHPGVQPVSGSFLQLYLPPPPSKAKQHHNRYSIPFPRIRPPRLHLQSADLASRYLKDPPSSDANCHSQNGPQPLSGFPQRCLRPRALLPSCPTDGPNCKSVQAHSPSHDFAEAGKAHRDSHLLLRTHLFQ